MPIATLERKTGRTTFDTGVSVDFVFKWPTDQTNLEDDATLANRKAVFYIWRTPLDTAGFTQTPKPGDRLTWTEGTIYTIDKVEAIVRDSQYRLTATRD